MTDVSRRNFLKACGFTVGCITVGGTATLAGTLPSNIPDEYLPDELCIEAYEPGVRDIIEVQEVPAAPLPSRYRNEVVSPDKWAQRAVQCLDERLQLAQYINRSMTSHGARVGDVVNTRRPVRFGQVDYVTNIPIPMSHHLYSSFIIKDREQSYSFDQLTDLFIAPATCAIAQLIDEAVYRKMADDEGVGAVAGTSAKATILQAKQRMFDNGCPHHRNTIAMSHDFAIAASPLPITPPEYPGEGYPRLFGCNALTMDCIPSRHAVMFNEDAVAMITAPLPTYDRCPGVQISGAERSNLAMRVTMGYDVQTAGVRVTLDTLVGIGVIEPQHITLLEKRQRMGESTFKRGRFVETETS